MILMKGQGHEIYEKLALKIYQKFIQKTSRKLLENGYWKPESAIVQYEIQRHETLLKKSKTE